MTTIVKPDKQDQAQVLTSPSLPSIFTLELTTRCEHACSGCANVEMGQLSGMRARHMVRWREIVARAAPYARMLRLSGGEPTLHPDFAAIVRTIDGLDIPHGLFTTGRWAGSRREQVLDLYTTARNTVGMLISLHGATATTHDSFVHGGEKAFHETCNNIALAAQAGINVFISCVLTRPACKEIARLVDQAQALGARHVVFNRFLAIDHPLLPSHAELRGAIGTIRALQQQGNPCSIGNNVPPCFISGLADSAKAGYELAHISPDGAVRPDNLSNYSFGNILKTGIETAWASNLAELYRRTVPEACLNCAAFAQCRGGAKSLQWHHGSTVADPLMGEPLWDGSGPGDGDKKDEVLALLTSD